MAVGALTEQELLEWMEKEDFPHDVLQSFKDNEMDGESLEALLTADKGPDCLKDLIPKLGVRLRVYKRIKSLCFNQAGAPANQVQAALGDHYGCGGDLYNNETGSLTDSSYKESSASTASSASDLEIARLRKEVSSLCKEKESLQLELKSMDKDKGNLANPVLDSGSSMTKHVKPKVHPSNSRPSSSSHQDIPVPFPIPVFRHSTEAHLKKRGDIPDSDRKYMVQTLATLLMTYKSTPSLKDCQEVSKSLHQKFKRLGDEDSECSWKWFIYNRTQNVNRPTCNNEEAQPRKKRKVDSALKHNYPAIPESADDEISNATNKRLLEEEWAKSRGQDSQKLKTLWMRTHKMRRAEILSSEDSSAFSIFQKCPMLKRCSYAKMEFELTMQNHELKDSFDEEFIKWS